MSGAGAPAPTRGEAARLGEVGGERAGLGGFVLLQRRGLEREQQALGLGRSSTPACVAGWSERFSPDRRLVEHDLDFAHLQVFGRADAGEHQQLRGVVGAAAEDHLALGPELLGLARAGWPRTPTARLPSNSNRWTCM